MARTQLIVRGCWVCGRVALAFVLSIAWEPPPAVAQPCASTQFPYRTMVRPINDSKVAADMGIGVGENRIIVTSNSGVRIHCKTGFLLTTQAAMAGLSALEIDTALFVPTTTGFSSLQIVDPRMIYDGHSKRYWIVACEQDWTPEARKARLHIAVSVDDTPDSWSTTPWRKYTGDGPTGAAGPSLNPAAAPFSPDQFAGDRIPDRPSIRVDDQFLYISLLCGRATRGFKTAHS